MIRVLALSTMLIASVATAQSPAVPVVADAAGQLSKIVLPRETAIATRLPRFEAAYVETLNADARLVGLEKKHPGIIEAVKRVAREEGAKAYGTAIDLLQADVAQLYRTGFTRAELSKLITFFTTPTGQAMIAMSAGASGETASDFEANRRRRAAAMLTNPDARTKADLMMLMSSGLLPKMRAINPQISALSIRRFGDVEALTSKSVPARIETEIATFTQKPKQ